MESYVKGKIPQIIFGSKSAQKVSGLLKKYEIKKCLLVTGHHVVRHSITQNVLKALSVEGIHCDVFDRVTPEPTDTLCLEIAYEIIANEYDCVLGVGGGSQMDGYACAMVLPTVVRHFALYTQKNIQKMAVIMGINVTGDAVKDVDAVANAIHVNY